MENNGEIILYQPDNEVRLEVRLENETVWLSIEEMSQLFGRDISVIGKHIRNIFKEGELLKESVWAKFAYTASDSKTYQVDYYNLDVIISVGYRVKSLRGTQFRQWANKVLKEYLLKGYSMNQRLLQLERQADARFMEHDRRLDNIDKKIDFFVRSSLPPVEGTSDSLSNLFPAGLDSTPKCNSEGRRVLAVDGFKVVPFFEGGGKRNTK